MAESKSAALPLGYAPPGPLEVAHGDSLLHSTWPLRPVSTRGRETKRYERRDHTCAVGDDQRLIRGFIRTAHQRSEVDGLPAHRSRVKPKRGWQSLRRSLATRFNMRSTRPPHHLQIWQTGHIQDTRRG